MKLVTCGIYERELKEIIKKNEELFSGIEPVFLAPALHVDLNALEQELNKFFNKEFTGMVLYGSSCLPELKEMCCAQSCPLPDGKDCAQVIAGKDLLNELSQSSKDFYLTPGWLEHYEAIFKEGLGWDTIDARQNFGFYDRVVLLDTGVRPIDDLEILEFYEYSQVIVEIVPISLNHFEKCLIQLLTKV
ncbi:MAG: DUF1638 domain-containing protein [Clostridia bacterium]|nr:DUF1638 domain-containing protein [Clostridia bacterium]